MIRTRVAAHPVTREGRRRDIWNLKTITLAALGRLGNTSLCAFPSLDLSWILILAVLSTWLMIPRQSLDPDDPTSRIRL